MNLEKMSDLETLSLEEGVTAIENSIGSNLTWKEAGQDFSGTLEGVNVQRGADGTTFEYIQMEVHVNGMETNGTLGTSKEGFSVEKDPNTGELHVGFNAYGPVRNLVISPKA